MVSKCTIYFVMQVLKQQFKTKIKLNRAKPTQSPIICTKVIKTLPNEIPRYYVPTGTNSWFPKKFQPIFWKLRSFPHQFLINICTKVLLADRTQPQIIGLDFGFLAVTCSICSWKLAEFESYINTTFGIHHYCCVIEFPTK